MFIDLKNNSLVFKNRLVNIFKNTQDIDEKTVNNLENKLYESSFFKKNDINI
ncbi:hypothetical protein [Borreliella lusitaniae]|uniref:hypothetical protein n=1 Tax=Borreliella lusitaniae TaxID=100177 RepID=UPI00292DE4E5|nr:hypothetical protein [Borreliella lusitaniae]WNY67216.1 hypothetical protein QIA40_04480 [Borreliella lusitaniae]